MKKLFLIILCGLVLAVSGAQSEETDKIQPLMTRFSDSPMINMNILIITRSPIFGNIDTTVGDVKIAADDRYYARFNDDIYLFDGHCVWEYSADNNQVTKDCYKKGEVYENELTALKDLKAHYYLECMIPDSLYRFKVKPDQNKNLPDSLIVTLDRRPGTLAYFSYNDLNGDVNDVIMLNYEFYDKIDPADFDVKFPDSVEVITLP